MVKSGGNLRVVAPAAQRRPGNPLDLSPTSQDAFGLARGGGGGGVSGGGSYEQRLSTAPQGAHREPLPPLGQDARRPRTAEDGSGAEWLGVGTATEKSVAGPDQYKFVFAQHATADEAAEDVVDDDNRDDAAVVVPDEPARRRPTSGPTKALDGPVKSESVHSVKFAADVDSQSMRYLRGGDAPRKTGVDMGTQSDYRESETQTDPWDPDIVPTDPSQTQPEVVFLKHAGLNFPDGWRNLTTEDMTLVDRAKQRARLAEQLPPLDDPSTLSKRQAMMQTQEQDEWAYRDEEIQNEHDKQVEMTRQGLALHVTARKERTNQILDGVAARADALAQAVYDKSSAASVKAVRANARERDRVFKSNAKKGIIQEFADPGSDLYAPRARLGHRRATGVEQLQELQPASVGDSDQLMHIEARLDMQAKTMDIPMDDEGELHATARQIASRALTGKKRAVRVASSLTANEKRAEALTRQLGKLETKLQEHANEKLANESIKPSIVEVVERPPERPPTPDIEDVIAEVEDRNAELSEDVLQAVLFFQRVLRGRAVQNDMYDGAEKRDGLIHELVQEKKARKQEKRRRAQQQEQRGVAGGFAALMAPEQLEINRIKQAHKEQLLNGAMETIFGALVSNGLDFLSSELVRQRELQRLRMIAEEANTARRERLTQEKIKRDATLAAQQARRRTYDAVMRVHRSMAELIVADLLIAAQEQIALVRMEDEMRAAADEERRLALLPKTTGAVVNDLLFGYLLPQVESESRETAATISEEQYFRAAHSALSSTLDDLFSLASH
jgi:cilia- and flagella-associated protein 91